MYDIAVVGGGPGGYTAAIRAAQLGARVLLVEKEKLGGVCLNRGCIPTKTLLRSAERWQSLQDCAAFGLRAENIGFDFAAVMARKDQVVGQLQAGVVQLVAANGIEVRYGEAALAGPGALAVSSHAGREEFAVCKIILATGSEPMRLPVPGADLPGVLTSDEVLALDAVPRSMVVVGSGAVGVEFAAIFRAFGCQVTVVEMLPTLLPSIDADLVKRMALLLRKQGIKMLTGAKVTGIRPGPDGLTVAVTTADGKELELVAEKVLAAAGRQPIVGGLGLEAAGVAFDRKGIEVNAMMETNVAGIYAVGDVTGRYMWAHAASGEGLAAVESALGGAVEMDYGAIPGCIFTAPEIAAVGLTEQEALAAGRRVKTGRFNFAANGKAVSMGEADGLVKVVADADDGKLLGMHILGPHASDLVMEGAIAIRHGLTAEDIGKVIHPHPTLAETVMESVHALEGRAIHLARTPLTKRGGG
ncbi:dihydrolipoyl dehydrogenase [Anaeroselena agilis]|uniref:Dihydrolipoyl dehydrogenase n=1 Tax=Anaeroselena agilis TaxID=3063788 RepID=A0ABU3P257_9FIRM|nr:dihydrolipoyl dehydrogenase [Selenomonadales bacterium 4137-cl]